jgi:2Fe-2S ferredoxin
MPRVTILPLDRTVEAKEGQTVMDAAMAAGLYWPTTCGGEGICTTCICTVEDGADNLVPAGRSEIRTLSAEWSEETIRARRLRLACQARVRGDVTVSKRGVRPAAPTLEGQ